MTILKDRYEVTYAFRSKSITFEETKGFTVDENYIRLHQMHDKSKPVKISKYLGDQFTFIAHLQKNYDDLDEADRAAEYEDLTLNPDYGDSINEREKRLNRATLKVKVLNFILATLSILILAYPNPWDLIVLLNLLLPIIAVVMVYNSKGLIKLNGDPNSLKPHVTYALMAPISLVGLRLIIDIKFLAFNGFWLYSIALTTVLFGLLFIAMKEITFKNKTQSIIAFCFLLFTFGYATCWITFINTIGDLDEPIVAQVEVVDKKESDNSYKLELDAGWNQYNSGFIDGIVSGSFYKKVKPGDIVYVEVYDGALNIPWFQIQEHHFKPKFDSELKFSLPDSL